LSSRAWRGGCSKKIAVIGESFAKAGQAEIFVGVLEGALEENSASPSAELILR